jgi:hypothetical protein
MTTTQLHTIKIATNTRNIGMMQGQIAGAAPLNSPTFTGDPKAPTPPTADNDTSIATTAFVKNQGYATLANPTFTGDPKAPTPATADNDTSIATTAFVKAQSYLTGNQTITLSGDISGSGTTAITATLATVNSNVGTFQGITVNGKGLVTAAVNQNYAPLANPTFTGSVTVSANPSSGYFFGDRGTGPTWLWYATGGSSYLYDGGTNRLGILSSTGQCLNTSGSWSAFSDPRVKDGAQPYTRGLAAVLALRPISYRYNGALGTVADPPEITRYGLDAAATESVMPELVGRHDGVLTIDAGPLIYALVNAIRELTARVAELEKKA